ncbi:MAG: RNA methyltransferase [Phycisphaerae bacterium]
MLNRVRVVLVEPAGPINVGAVSRAMANFGLRELVLVDPRCDWTGEQAQLFAVHGRAVLSAARVVPDIPSALDGCIASFATSARLGLYRRQNAAPPRVAVRDVLEAAGAGLVAVAFGRENNGFHDRELLQFDRIITIPADESYPALNLAAAVTVIAYELFGAALARRGQPPLPTALPVERARDEQKRVMFERLFDALDGVGFFFGQNPDHLRFALRHMLGRLDLSANEVDILIGLARQIRWHVDHHPRRVDTPSE